MEYSRNDAAYYALRYGLTPNIDYRYFPGHSEGGGDCTNFISQCLHAGGAPMDFKGPWPWWYGKSRWSASWAVANSLYWCLKSRYKLHMSGLKGMEVKEIDMLEIGDIIQYENFNGLIYHSAIITGFEYRYGKRQPLISQHSYDGINIGYIKPASKAMHFMKIILDDMRYIERTK